MTADRERRRRQRRRPVVAHPVGPPEDGEVWLDASTAAELLGWTVQWVGRLAAQERLPAVKLGRKWWLRRRDVEIYAAARVFAESGVDRHMALVE